jgi:predicted lipoprotein
MLFSCSEDNDGTSAVDSSLNQEILTDFSQNIAQSVYGDLQSSAETLYSNVNALATDGATNVELKAAQDAWRSARTAWEQSEAFLFGPVSTESIDPRIDTWPVNFTDLDAQLSSGHAFTEEYINDLEDALKGFHPIEYLLFGENGNKTADQITARDLEYLQALALNLKTLTGTLAEEWNTSNGSGYLKTFVSAGSGSTVYTTQLEAFEELVNSMSGICDEVANGKISEPFLQKNPSLEESPFASSSISDFTNNIKGVQNVYLGKYTADGKGLEDLVKKYNLQLDAQIKTKISAAIAALNNITVPFGRAITEQPILVQNAIDAIEDLHKTLDESLLPFVREHAK